MFRDAVTMDTAKPSVFDAGLPVLSYDVTDTPQDIYPADLADLDVGLLIYNAAFSVVGPFWNFDVDTHLKDEVNVVGPLVLAHGFGERFRARAAAESS
jgi:short-subunit dehydrogenase